MSSKRRAAKLPDRLADEPTRTGSVSVPSDSLLHTVIGRLKTLKGAIVAIAGVGAVLGGLAGYWNAYQAARSGGVQRSGDQIRINAQLADTTNNAQLWSESFDGSQGDLFALQEIVTARIGNSIGREMVVVAARDSERHGGDPRAADLMMRASALSLSPIALATYEERENLYRQALLLEPNNARALAGLAASLSVPAANGFIVDAVAREQKLVEARDLALKARAIDPSLPSIYVTLSDYSDTHGDYEGARQASETALSLEPKNPWRYSNLAADYLMAGKATRQEPRPDRDLRAAGDGVCTQRGPSPVAHRCCRSVARGPEVQAAKFRNAKDRGPTIRVPDVVEGETAAGVAPRTPARIA